MGLKDKLAKTQLGKVAEMTKVAYSPEVKQLRADAKERAKDIDYAELAKTAQAAQATGAQGAVMVGASAEQIALANLAQKLVQSGIDTPGEITAMTATGNTDATGSSEYKVDVTLTPEGGEPYETTINQYLLPNAGFAEGGAITARVDPDDKMQALLWGTR